MRSSRAGEPAPDKNAEVGSGPILKEGWLTKKGEKRRNWKVRWFVLRKGSMTYAKKAGERPKGVIPLKSPTLAKSNHKPFCFAVNVTTRTYLITAKSNDEMNSWLAAILDASELPPADKEVMKAEAHIVAAVGDDHAPGSPPGPRAKKVVIVLRSKADIDRERVLSLNDGPESNHGSRIQFQKEPKDRDAPMSAGQQLTPRSREKDKDPSSPRSPRSPRKTQSARGIIVKRPESEGPGSGSRLTQKKTSVPESNSGRLELSTSNSSLGKGTLQRTTTYSPGTTVPAPPLTTAPGSVLKSPPRKTERSDTALDDSLFALLDDLTEIVKAGGGASPRDEEPVIPLEANLLLRRSPAPLPPPPSPYSQSLSVSSLLSAETNTDRWRTQSQGDVRVSVDNEKQSQQNYRKSMMVVMFEGEKKLANLKEEKRQIQEELIATLEIKTRLDAQLQEINRQLSDVENTYRGQLERIRRIEEEMILTMEQTENQKRSAARLAQVDDITTKRVAVEVKKKVAELNSEGRGRKGTGLARPNQTIVPRISTAGGDLPSTDSAESGGSVVANEEKKGFFSRFGGARSPRNNPVAEDITEEEMRLWQAPLQRPFVKWAEPDISFPNNDLISTAVKNEYNLELGSASVRGLPLSPQFEEDDRYYPFYLKIYYQKDHVNFLGMDDILGPIIVSVESPPKDRRVRCLVRTKKEDQHLVLPTAKDRRKGLVAQCPELANIKFQTSEDQSLCTDLVSFEKPFAETKYKFGILYCRGNQSAEDEMYNNVDTSAEFEEFLDFMGERILLQGFDKFRGGLNVTNGGTGKYSIYTNFRTQEVMFHVATMLPFKPEDPQQLERKRHLGNDVVLIIFKDGNSTVPFNPKVIRSQFNHIFCVIQVDTSKPPNRRHYKVAISTKGGVPSFGPPLPAGGSFEKSPELRNFLLTKLINGERAATLYAPDFRLKTVTARKLFLEEMVLSHGSKK